VANKTIQGPEFYFITTAEWHDWLAHNRNQSEGVWLIFYKKGSGQPSLNYESAVEEALCFGWIDSIIRNIDTQKYARKFTPRREGSIWSELNKKRIAKLIRERRMTKIGLAQIETAKHSGQWDKSVHPHIDYEMPDEFQSALVGNPKACAFFEQLAPTYQKQYVGWINIAKQQKTRARRILESIALLESGQKLGLK